MMNMHQRTLCLLFVVRKGKLKDVVKWNRSKIKAYALLPHATFKKQSNVRKVLLKNGIQIVSDGQKCLSLQRAVSYDSVEIVELLVDEVPATDAFKSQTPTLLKFQARASSEEVIRLLLGNEAVSYHTSLDTSCFCKTIDNKNLKAIEYLLSHKVDISFNHAKAGNLFHLAAMRGHDNLVKLLLRHGANIDAKRNDYTTALHLSVRNENFPMVKLLLKNGANVDARTKGGSTALHIASRKGYTQTVRFLLKNGARARARKYNGSTALHCAALCGHLQIVKELILNGANIDATFPSDSIRNNTPLCLAVLRNNYKIAKLLLENGANVNAQIYHKLPVLELAILTGCPKMVDCVLNYHPDLNDKNNMEAFYYCVLLKSGKEFGDIVKKLHRYGFSFDAKYKNDSDLLHAAVCNNYFEIVRELLHLGANVNKLYCPNEESTNEKFRLSPHSKCTPLHAAAKFAEGALVQLLINHGADVNAKSSNGLTPIIYAIENSNISAVRVLIANGVGVGSSNDPLYHAVVSNNSEMIETLVLHGADVNSSCGSPPLYTAAWHGNLNAIKVLLKFGASVNCTNYDGESVLHAAAQSGSPEIVEVVLQNGADVNAKDCHGCTPLFYLPNERATNIFLNFGASLDLKDRRGRTILHEVAIMREHSTFKVFLDYTFTETELLSKTNICGFFDETRSADDIMEKIDFYYDDYNFQNAAVIIAQHLIKLKAADQPVDEKIKMPNWYCTEISMCDFQSQCEAEIANMKKKAVTNTKVLFYDVLTKNVAQIVCYARNTNFVKALNSKDYKLSFPIYASILDFQFQKGLQRKKLLEQGIKVCRSLFHSFVVLPQFLKETILGYLSNQEILILISACS